MKPPHERLLGRNADRWHDRRWALLCRAYNARVRSKVDALDRRSIGDLLLSIASDRVANERRHTEVAL